MTKPTLALLAALATLSLSSCLDVVNIDTPESPALLAVEGQITDEARPATVGLTLTQGYFNQAAPTTVSGALLVLTDDLGAVDTLRETAPGRYVGRGTVRGRTGGSYVLRLTALGQTYEAVTEIRRTPPIDSVRLVRKDQPPRFEPGLYAIYYGPELPGVGDYVRIRTWQNDTLANDPGDLRVFSDELVDGNYLGDIPLNDDPLRSGEKVKVEMTSITRDYYYYLNEMFTQINNVGLFATTPANVRTNVRNVVAGTNQVAVGYFAGFTVRQDSVVVP
ncbi:DUF4249 domain-containing protein [Hymenobacter sp. ASUV-10]|uniref:DUF4249 domain-containing protein n=1 Tax=Hymenobacter aranciens TaxID=3063996 RepID=A0ABT9BF08_9BACT|nr:DUF4249 domain-containing protein [Hymenobacter sp. ASUV-10]MDO7876859.1 DUF4249 domain-containing protein [Hymenobacter sp. ASUV-10]